MNLKVDLQAYLTSYAPLAALVGDRIYGGIASQTVEVPFVVTTKVFGGLNYTHCGPTLSSQRMQISCYAQSYAGAEAVAKQVKSALHAWQYKSFIEDAGDNYEDDTKLHAVLVNATIWIKEVI